MYLKNPTNESIQKVSMPPDRPTEKIHQAIWLAGTLLLSSIIILLCVNPIPQDMNYHNFAETRRLVGIRNAWNVLSNLPFLLIGIYGLLFCGQNRQQHAPYSWLVFFAGISLVSAGSAYYHWMPNNTTLVWDRIPMTIAFMGLFIGLLSEIIDTRIEKKLLAPAVAIGVFSVVYWWMVDDLRFYGLIQFFPLAVIPLVVMLVPTQYTHGKYLLYGLGFYMAAKVFEAYDREIFSLINISGHSIKHGLAAGGALMVLLMIIKRRLITA